jgi:predicted nucleic acid-binding protein
MASEPHRIVADTSIFIALEHARPLERPLPDQVAVSVVTLAELELGVLRAGDVDARSIRLATLTRVRERSAGLPADDRVASAYARLAAAELAAGRRPRVNDVWIAATALVHGAEVWTRDDDFSSFDGVAVVRV